MIAKDYCYGEWKLLYCLNQLEITIAEITHKKNCIRLKLNKQISIISNPSTMQVSNDGEA
tara:strand:- start:85 stop:264 length:180 start_codon:yes stop_codon:yes gene_type:complete